MTAFWLDQKNISYDILKKKHFWLEPFLEDWLLVDTDLLYLPNIKEIYWSIANFWLKQKELQQESSI